MSRKRYQEIAETILAAIGEGKYTTGMRLPTERELAEEFGVSRPTVREAMIALEMAGVVEIRHGSGIWVAGPSGKYDPQSEFGPFEIIEARRVVEGEAAALAAITITGAELQRLEAHLQQMKEDPGSPQGEAADREFHLEIARATSNGMLVDLIASLWTRHLQASQSAAVYIRARLGGFEQPVEDHESVLDALRRRDPDAARTAMQAHLDHVFQELADAIESDAIERVKAGALSRAEEWRRRIDAVSPKSATRS